MKDATLGGYLSEHERPPAFSAADGFSYTVEIMTEREEPGGWRAYLFFLRWRGGEPVGHVETDYLAEATDEESVRAGLEAMTLHDVKGVLDGLVRDAGGA